MKILKYGFVVIILIVFAAMFSCKHELDFNIPINPVDTTHHPVDTTHIVDTTHVDTCAAGVISFTEDVLPILLSNCAKSGCHDAISHKEGVNTTSYQTLMSTTHISSTNPLSSKFWRSISGGGDVMPPPPNSPLTPQQLQIIKDWLLQGAQNTTCTHHAGGCDTTNVSFTQYIYPVIQNYCLGCHSSGSSQGGVNLSGYSNVMVYINNGQLMKSIKHDPSVVAMPNNGPAFNDCMIAKFQSWVNHGSLNN